MIVQCDECNAKFRLDDSKVKEGGAKVRCSKCKHIFFVQRETTAEESDFSSVQNVLVPTSPEDGKGSAAETANASETEMPFDVEPKDDNVAEKDGFEFGEFSFDSESATAPTPAPFPAETEDPFHFGEVSIEGAAPIGDPGVAEEETVASFDYDEFSFTEDSAPPVSEVEISIDGFDEPAMPAEPITTAFSPASHTYEKDPSSSSALEFSFEPEGAEPAIAPTVPVADKFENELESFEFGDLESDIASSTESMGDIALPTAEPKAWEWDDQELPSDEKQEDAYVLPETLIAADEPPPLSIASRRRGASGLPITVTAVSALLVTALAGGGFYVFKEGASAFNKIGMGFVAKWVGLETKEEGSIGIKNSEAAFLRNNEAGEIFVINGQAINNFTKPRAAIQVKVVVYGPKGESLLQKTAYCGNALSKDQLTTLPMAKLESAMANQFGDSLSNLALQPGKGIPFVVVFSNVPKEAVDFGVEVVGSTVAGK